MSTKRRIFTTSLMLMLMVVVLGTGVFAWFTINTRSSATGLSGTAEAADGGFYIRIKDESPQANENFWTTELNLAGKLLLGDTVLNPLTTKDGITFTNLAGDEITNGYFEFTFEFLTGENFSKVYLEELTMATTTPTSWLAEYDVAPAVKGDKLNASLVDAIRVAFIDEDPTITGTAKTRAIIENVASTTPEVSGTNEWTFNNTVGFGGFALAYLNAVEDNVRNIPSDVRNTGIVDKVNDFDAQEGIFLSKEKADATGDQYIKNSDDAAVKLDASFKYISTVTVRVWLEGWDGEAFNAVASGQVDLRFIFRAKEA